MKNFSIPSPCSENWNEMSKTEKGAFCQKCAHEVNDVTTFSNTQIRDLFRTNAGKRTCVRMTVDQEESLHRDYEVWNLSNKKHMQRAMLFSLLVVFGLTLFSCTSPQQAQELNSVRANVQSIIEQEQQKQEKEQLYVLGEIEPVQLEGIQEEPIRLINQEIEIEPEVRTLEKCIDKVEVVEHEVTHEVYMTMGVPAYNHQYLDIVESQLAEKQEMERLLVEDGPVEFSAMAYPNPASESTTVSIDMPVKAELVVVRFLDMSGRVLNTVFEGPMNRGTHEYPVSMIDLKPATYLVDVRYGDTHEVVRVVKSH